MTSDSDPSNNPCTNESKSGSATVEDVRRTYDRIAPHFSDTRSYAWPAVEEFIRRSSGRFGVDVGCGNGRHAELLAGQVDRVLGVDVSRGVLQEARYRAKDRDYPVDLIQGNAAALPLQSDSFQVALYIAALHHLPTRTLRVRSLRELGRVLTASGRALVSGWSVSHDRFDETKAFDTDVTWTLPSGETVPRYYHIYDLQAFRADLTAANLTIKEMWEEAGNCYGIVQSPEQ